MDPRAAFRCGAQARIIWKVPSTLTPRIFWNTAASSASQFAAPVTVAALHLPEIDSDPIYPFISAWRAGAHGIAMISGAWGRE